MSPHEEHIASVVAEVLGRPQVGREDDLFALAGPSPPARRQLAGRLAARLREALGREVPLAALIAHPSVARLAAWIGASQAGAAVPPIERAASRGEVPLSYGQQRLWFLTQLEPGAATYNVPMILEWAGPLDLAALQASLDAIERRHEILRTTFRQRAGHPFQLVGVGAATALPVTDLSALPRGPRAGAAVRLAEEESRRPFDIEAGPVWRFRLLRLDGGMHWLVLTLHHIVCDGWSIEVLLHELGACYQAFAAGDTKPPLPALPIQYGDYALWQHRHLTREALAAPLAAWKRRLVGHASALELPVDRTPPATRTAAGASLSIELPASLLEAAKEQGRRQGITLFMTVLAVFEVLLARYTGRREFLIGTPVANRTRPELKGLIGYLADTLVLPATVPPEAPFRELLAQVREVAVAALRHQDLPLEMLVQELAADRDQARLPLLQAALTVHNAPTAVPAMKESSLRLLEVGGSGARFDLSLVGLETESGLGLLLEYSTELFSRPAAQRLLGHFAALFESAVTGPKQRLSELPLVSPAERQQLVAEWNDTRAAFPETTLLHQFFEASVERAPEALAAVCAGNELTYAGLEAGSNRLAQLLSRLGVERGAPVGVWVERSLDLLTAVLGVLKAGAHYVALDDTWPAGRVESILASTGARTLVVSVGLQPDAEEMRWRLPVLSNVVCQGITEPEPLVEAIDPEGVRALWDLVAERAVDRVTAGGFISAFTDQPMSEAEVDEYRDRVLALAGPWLHGRARVLEIGNGSGLLLWEMASRVAHVTGLDPSPLTQERNRARLEREGVTNIRLATGFAHELDRCIGDGERFDLILLASTVQFFPGPRYLERVIRQAAERLAPGGALLVADVLDARRRDELRRAIDERRGSAGTAARQELSLDEGFFRELGAAIHHRTEGFANELGFRYDVVLTEGALVPAEERRCRLWTRWHLDRCPAGRLPQAAGPDDIAYVIHTSGSTGEPKGIVVQHRPVANLIAWINRTFEVGPEDRGLFVTSLCFDLSVYDIFGMLAAGGTIHVATREELGDPGHLVRLLRSGGITLWDSAPAALVQLAPLFPPAPDASSRLRRVLLSGDWIPVTLPDRVRQAFPNARVMALGGATEATVWSNWFPVAEVDPSWPSIPYGRPIANARYHVLDRGFFPCPVGVPGDLYIGGDCLCAGYRQPELTARAFLPDPFAAAPGARLYRTGDRARTQADGNIEFLGRLDQQVKVRGYRIELGEIEVALARHPAVREAVVLVREDEPGDRRLVAYLVPADAGEPAPADLRDSLRQSLPDYMIPAAFVTLPELPVTPNGKLDRAALPAPRWSAGSGLVAPRTPVEETLAALWSSVLGIAEVGREDSFFDLGGHSLLATQMLSRVREACDVELSLRTVFDRPKLAELAAEIEALRSAGATPRRQPVISNAGAVRNGPLPLSFAQQRFWFLQQLNPDSSAFHLSGAVRLSGRLDAAVLEASFGEIVRRHAAVRTRFVAIEGVPRQIVDPPVPFLLPRVDLSSLGAGPRERELRRVAASAAHRPFRLAAEPPLRVLLLRLAEGEHVVLFSLHHIAGDGWSLEILTRELGDLYAAGVGRRPSPLPELPVQYADWAVAHHEWLRGPGAAAQLAWWRRQLGGDLPVLALPMQRQRPAAPRFRGAAHPLAFGMDLSAALADLGRGEGATLFMSLLAGFKALLHLATGGEDLLVGTNVANREWPGVEGLIGLFVNDLALRTDLSGRPTFRELLARVRETVLAAHAHQDLPFEAIVADLRPERAAGPLFQVMLVLQTFGLPVRELPGLTLAPLAGEARTANFDLVLTLGQGADGLAGAFVYDVDLFDASAIARLAEHFTLLLRTVVADPDRPLHSLSFAPRDAARQMASAFSEDL